MYANLLNVMKDEKVTFNQIGELLGYSRYQTVSDIANGETKKDFTMKMHVKSIRCFSRNTIWNICLNELKTNKCSMKLL